MGPVRRLLRGRSVEELKRLREETGRLVAEPVQLRDFQAAARRVRGSVRAEDARRCEEWAAEFGTAAAAHDE